MAGEPLDVLLRVRMRYEAEGVARKALGDLDQFEAKSRQLGTALAGARVGRELQGIATQSQAARREMVDLGQAAARFGTMARFDRVGGELRGLVAPAQAARREVVALDREMRRLGDDAGLRGLERGFERAARSAEGMRRQAERAALAHRREFGNEALAAAGAGGALRFGMSGAGVAGVAAGATVAAVGAGIAAASREARTFESAMADVRKAVDDISPEKFKALESTILRTSRIAGVSKEQMAQLVAEAGFAGRPTEDLPRFAEFGAKAAGAFNMPLGETGDKLAKLGNVFKLTQDGIEDLADGINVLGDNTASKERQIIDFLTRTGQTGSALRFTGLQTAAIGAAAIATGKEAEVAATGFNAFALKLGDAEHQSKEFKEGLRGLGLSARQLKAEMASNPVEAFLKVLERIDKLPDNKKLEAANKLGGMEYGDDLIAYAGAREQIRAALAKIKDQSARAGSVEKAFKIVDDTTQRQIDRATASMEAFATKVGQKFNPAIAAAAHYVERLFGGMTKAIERGERAEALAGRLAKGIPLTKQEQAEVDANPRLKSDLDKSLFFERRRLELEENRRKADKDPASLPSMDDARKRFEERARQFEERRQRVLNPETPALPGTGKRSDLREDAKIGLAAYHEEVERSLERTKRVVHEAAREMREDLAIKAHLDFGGDRFGTAGGARIEMAAYGGGGLGGGLGGGGGPVSRFGGLGGGRGSVGGPAGSGGGAGAIDGPAGDAGEVAPRGDGRGDSGAAKTGQMMAYAMDQLRREGVPEDKLREAAAQLVGQATMESGLDPNKTHDHGTGFGIYGARDPTPGRGRRTDMLRWLASNGYASNSAEGQVRYMAKEAMSGRYPQTKRILMGQGSGDIAADTYAVTREFESPKIVNSRAHAVQNAMRAGPQGDGGAGRPGQAAGVVSASAGAGGVDQRQGGVRNQPITPQLRDQLAYAGAQAGVRTEVYSGGQDAHGSRRTGSHRHDHGQSADVRLYRTDGGAKRYLSMNDPDDRAAMEKYVAAGVQAGVTGVGAGPGYMGDKGIHMGGGPAGTWGAGGRSANAPDWVRRSHAAGLEARRREGVDASAWARRGEALTGPEAAMSARPVDPGRMKLRQPGAADVPGAGAGRQRMAGGPPVIQHFHGGFDEQATARRAVLEQNREIRRSQARALHDIGRVA